jgi:hypothetical protein
LVVHIKRTFVVVSIGYLQRYCDSVGVAGALTAWVREKGGNGPREERTAQTEAQVPGPETGDVLRLNVPGVAAGRELNSATRALSEGIDKARDSHSGEKGLAGRLAGAGAWAGARVGAGGGSSGSGLTGQADGEELNIAGGRVAVVGGGCQV